MLQSSIGKKALMAVSGLMLVGFVIAHLLGNLQIFLGPQAINAYAVKLRHYGALLWVARGLLLLAAVVHIRTSIQLSLENRRARGTPYAVFQPGVTGLAARSMLLTGLLLLSYLVYHLLHFTFRTVHPELTHAVDALGQHDVYRMMVRSFQDPWISGTYILGMAVLSLHLAHGFGSAFQTLGLANERTIPATAVLSRVAAALIFLGYASIPAAVLFGWIV